MYNYWFKKLLYFSYFYLFKKAVFSNLISPTSTFLTHVSSQAKLNQKKKKIKSPV